MQDVVTTGCCFDPTVIPHEVRLNKRYGIPPRHSVAAKHVFYVQSSPGIPYRRRYFISLFEKLCDNVPSNEARPSSDEHLFHVEI